MTSASPYACRAASEKASPPVFELDDDRVDLQVPDEVASRLIVLRAPPAAVVSSSPRVSPR